VTLIEFNSVTLGFVGVNLIFPDCELGIIVGANLTGTLVSE
jgi:hypothetical protein